MAKQQPPRGDGPVRPSARDAVARAQAAAAPRIAKAAEAAGPAVEKAANTAGKLLGTLRERARETMKEFNSALSEHDDAAPPSGAQPPAGEQPTEQPPAADTTRPRPRPRPGPSA
jgi:hypothetical protein